MSRIVTRYGRLLIVIALLAFTAVFLTRQRHDLQTGFALLLRVEPVWFAALLTIQLLLLAVSAMTYQKTLVLLGHRLSLWRLIDIHLQRHLIGTIAPLGGPASVYVFVRALGKRGICANDALFAIALRGGVGSFAFATLVVPTVIASNPAPIITAAAAGMAIFVILLIAMLALLMNPVDVPERLERRLPGRILEFAAQARHHDVRLRDLVSPFVLAMIMNLGSVVMLYVSLRAIGQDASVVRAGAAFSIGNVLQMVAPVAQGTGLVEVTMAAAMQQVGIGSVPAITATLLYRLGDLWTPLLLGLGVLTARSAVTSVVVRGSVATVSGIYDRASALLTSTAGAWSNLGRQAQTVAVRVVASAFAVVVATDLWRWPVGMAAIVVAPPAAHLIDGMLNMSGNALSGVILLL